MSFSTIITGLVRVILGYPQGSRVPSYSNTEVWTVVHAGMSIVCASLPILRPLLKRIVGSALVTRLSSFQITSLSHIRTSQSTQQSSVERKPDGTTQTSETPLETSWQLPAVEEAQPARSLSVQWTAYLARDGTNTHSSLVIEPV